MKCIFLIFSCCLFFSCASNKALTHKTTVKYNHISGKVITNDTILESLISEYEDELTLRINVSRKIIKITPLNFRFENDIKISGREAYFYSGDMSEYMQHNTWFNFEIEYK